MINVHGSLLPRYRGAAPVHRAVIAGDETTGVTIMRVVTELDAGAMFLKVERPIGINDTSVEVEQDLAEIGASALIDVVEQLAAGRANETPQDNALATYAPKLEKSEGPIIWSLPAREIHNRVRGLQPWPMASTLIDGQRFLIHRTALTDRSMRTTAGSVVDAAGDLLTIAAGDGALLRILLIQPEGRRAMTAREFLSGRKVNPGTIAGGA
jgi:methionyl-tRNA formyltransferase